MIDFPDLPLSAPVQRSFRGPLTLILRHHMDGTSVMSVGVTQFKNGDNCNDVHILFFSFCLEFSDL